jgi:DNA repair photolyase
MFEDQNPLNSDTEPDSPIIVRETVCKTILNKCSISDFSLNCYTGCANGCVYCYARFMERFHPHDEPWGEFVDVKINAVEALKKQLRRTAPGDVFVSSACDGWQPIEADYCLTRRCCELLLEHGFRVNLLTKSGLVRRDFDIFSGHDVNVGVSITTLDERLAKLWEPQGASTAERLQVIEDARNAGLKTTIMFAPLLPFLFDGRESLEALFQYAADLRVDSILVDAMNPRPKVWPSVEKFLREHFPELLDRYRGILFNHKKREVYLSELRDNVATVTERLSLNERLTVCF